MDTNTKIGNFFAFNTNEFSILNPLAFSILVFLLLAVVLLLLQNKYLKHILRKLDKSESNLKEEIQASVQPKFLETSMEARDLIDLAIEVWRIDQRLSKVTAKIPENDRKALENSILKIKRFIDKQDLEIRDYTGQKYNTGLSAAEIISVDKDKKVKESIVKETIEPAILLKGQVVKKAKIIVSAQG